MEFGRGWRIDGECLRQLLFGGTVNIKNSALSFPTERIFKIPNVDGVIEEGKKAPKKFRDMKVLAGNISSDFDFTDERKNGEKLAMPLLLYVKSVQSNL
ncbi:unnamed protein product [Vicia faba]|uniref:Uncharacterized protein n=1 Tax=Vicia faba TaxID=3906 RepID=A0AAV1AXF6_VICFA|nr:unnamed protein product [Vicia faba]